jgi:tRNA A-37 threonylcarbamoyl transferase component Bud32
MEHPDGDSIGDYRLLKLLGQGAAGRVYLATSTREKAFAKPGDPLAVKVYKPEILERMHQLDRIRREFEVGSSVSHPHLIHMYENSLGETGGRPFLVMQYVDGLTLDSWLSMFHPVSGRLRARLLAQLVGAVRELHQTDVIHRDLKPQNVMVSSSFDGCVMDLGVVRTWNDPPITPSDEFLGSIRNSSPEMLFGEDYGKSTDIYSLGTILYALLHGEQVFQEETQFARLVELVRHDTPYFDEGVSALDEISDRLLTLCRELLQKDPGDRPESLDAVRARLDEIAGLGPTDETFEPLHGYVATALTGLDPDARDAVAFAANLIAEVGKHFQIYIYQPRRFTDPLMHADVTPEAVYLQDRKRVLAADVLFVLLNEPSFGVGQEIEIAASIAKPVVLLSRLGTKVSRMVRGSFANIVGEVECSTPEELERGLRRLLQASIGDLRQWKGRSESQPRHALGVQIREWRRNAGFETVSSFADHLSLPQGALDALEQGD